MNRDGVTPPSSLTDLGWPLHDRPDLHIIPSRALRVGDTLFESLDRDHGFFADEPLDMGTPVQVIRVRLREHAVAVMTSSVEYSMVEHHVDSPVLVRRSPPTDSNTVNRNDVVDPSFPLFRRLSWSDLMALLCYWGSLAWDDADDRWSPEKLCVEGNAADLRRLLDLAGVGAVVRALAGLPDEVVDTIQTGLNEASK